MLNTRNITMQTLKRDKKNEEERKKYHRVMEQLSFFGKKRLSRIDDLTHKIIKTIKIDSLWEFTFPHTFTYLSDFHFDPERQEITYVVNRVEGSDDGYQLRDNPTKREIAFFTKYEGMLKQLFNLEQKRQAIYAEHIIEGDEKVIPFDQIVTRSERVKENQDNNFVVGYSQVQMDNFIREYHTDGIRRLIKLLNDLDNAPDPYAVYTGLRSEISGPYIQSLLEWAATYSPKAQFVLDKIAEERMKQFYEISGFPSYEERMTDNITKLL